MDDATNINEQPDFSGRSDDLDSPLGKALEKGRLSNQEIESLRRSGVKSEEDDAKFVKLRRRKAGRDRERDGREQGYLERQTSVQSEWVDLIADVRRRHEAGDSARVDIALQPGQSNGTGPIYSARVSSTTSPKDNSDSDNAGAIRSPGVWITLGPPEELVYTEAEEDGSEQESKRLYEAWHKTYRKWTGEVEWNMSQATSCDGWLRVDARPDAKTSFGSLAVTLVDDGSGRDAKIRDGRGSWSEVVLGTQR